MTRIMRWVIHWKLWLDEEGQDLVEYALLAALTTVAAGLFAPNMSDSIDKIFSRIASKLTQASST